MSDVLSGLSPRSVWEHFAALTQIPRPSKKEERVVEHVLSLAKKHGFKVQRDGVGNLVIDVPASPGHEGAPTVILQGHLDMVCEKNKDVTHDFDNDPIRAEIDGDWVTATGTTLGADNGIGVAACLAAATDDAVKHGPLQLLFTLDEETGLTGAKDLDPALLSGKTLINLDSEEDGVLFVGCAGGTDTVLHLDPKRTDPAPGTSPFVLEVTGLRGGHSGLNIHENRGNAVKLAVRVLLAAMARGIDFSLVSIQGGSKHNAIPREAEAHILLDPGDESRFREVLAAELTGFRTELAGIDEGLEIALRSGEPGRPLSGADRDRLLRLLAALPHGVLAMSADIPGLVETSNNLASVDDCSERLRIITSSRSSVDSAIRGVLQSIRSAGELAGSTVEHQDGYPGWKPNLASPVLKVAREVYREQWKAEPTVTAIHAGLECGLLGEKLPGLDMVSFGPQIEGAHSPDERVSVASVDRFWTALKDILARLAA